MSRPALTPEELARLEALEEEPAEPARPARRHPPAATEKAPRRAPRRGKGARAGKGKGATEAAPRRRFSWRRARAVLSVLAAVVVVHWYFPPSLYWPMEYLDTFFHEGGHALAAVLTGGEVTELVIQESGAGFARTRGGIRAFVMSMGYLGPAVAGALLLLLNSVRWTRRWILRATGLLILGVAGMLGGSMFTMLFAGVTGTFFLILGWGLWPEVQFHLVNVMGIAIGSSSLRGLKHLFLMHIGKAKGVAPSGIGHTMSDAEQMEKLTHLPAAFWAAAWTAIAAFLLWKALRRALRAE